MLGAGTGAAAVTLGALVAVASGLLVPAGIAKLRAPTVARDALGLPIRADALVRVVGAGELVLAAVVLTTGARPAVAVLAATYLVFTAVALRQRSRGESCGCFGASDTPTGWHHVVVDAVAAGTAGVAALLGVPSAVALIGGGPLAGVPTVVAGLVAVAAVQLIITALPDLATARRAAGGTP